MPWIGAAGTLPQDLDIKAESSPPFYSEEAEAQRKSAPFPHGAVGFKPAFLQLMRHLLSEVQTTPNTLVDGPWSLTLALR